MLPELCAALMVVGLTAYALLAGADFGAGFWDLTAGGAHRGGRVRGMVKHSMGPVWEANHVWLIFVLVVFWTCFPTAFGSVTSTLYVPLFLAALGIIFRGAAFAVRGEAATINEARVLGAVFALSSVLTPFFLGTVLGGIAAGEVPVGNAVGDPVTSWLNPTSVLVGALAVVTGAYLAAVYLAADAARLGLPDLVSAFRARALGAGAVAGVAAIGGLAVLEADAPELFDGLTEWPGIAAVIVSAVAGLGTIALVWRQRFELARVTAAAAVASVAVGWAIAQSPALLPGQLTIEAAAADDATLTAALIGIAGGLLILVPALWFLYGLVLRGRLDQGFEPLDQPFQPLRAGDEKPGEGSA
jgi:cytochrome d ubiquinol oxidase subunit II